VKRAVGRFSDNKGCIFKILYIAFTLLNLYVMGGNRALRVNVKSAYTPAYTGLVQMDLDLEQFSSFKI
jgi:hypothetical protein